MNRRRISHALGRACTGIWVLCAITFLAAASAGAHEIVALEDAPTDYDIGVRGLVHADPDGHFDEQNLPDLLEHFAGDDLDSTTPERAERFWFLVEVQNNTEIRDWVVSFHAPMVRRVFLFDFDQDGEFAARSTGYDAPVEDRTRPAFDYALPLTVAPGDSEVVVVLVEDPAGELPAAGDIRIAPEESFRTQTFRMIAAALLSLGAVLAVGIYMLLIWARLRERTYLWFGCFALSSFVLWGTHYELFRMVIGRALDLTLLNFLANAGSLAFCVLFVRSFLHVDRWSRTWDRAALGVVCVLLMLLGVTPLLSDRVAYLANASGALLALVFVVAVGVVAKLERIERAGVFLLAWAVYFSTGLLTIADALGMGLPTVSIRLMTAGALALGTLLMAWAVGDQLQELISQKRLAEHQARTDSLTQLGNRALFDDELEHLQHQYDAELISDLLVLFADLDGLKRINDTHGHDVGDELLKDFALHLKERFRNVDGIFRVGGDEFILLLPDAKPTSADWMPERVDRIIADLQDAGYAEASVSIGIAMLSETDGNARNAVRLADERMYAEKDNS